MARLPYGADLAVRCGGADGEVNDRAVVGDGLGEHCDPKTGAYQAAQSGDVFTFEGQLRYESRFGANLIEDLTQPVAAGQRDVGFSGGLPQVDVTQGAA